jgi:hypothetical protein
MTLEFGDSRKIDIWDLTNISISVVQEIRLVNKMSETSSEIRESLSPSSHPWMEEGYRRLGIHDRCIAAIQIASRVLVIGVRAHSTEMQSFKSIALLESGDIVRISRIDTSHLVELLGQSDLTDDQIIQ